MTEASGEKVLEAWNQAVLLWNVFGLPALMVAVTVGSFRRGRAAADRSGIVGRIGLTEYALAAWWMVRIVSEVWSARTQGWAQANPPVLLFGLVAGLGNTFLGFGLRRFWRAARWLAIAWLAMGAALTIFATVLLSAGSFDLTEWPRQLLPISWPLFAFGVLLSPATGRVFASPKVDEPAVALAIGTRLFLTAVVSGVVVDALDWAIRALVEVSAR